jgi:hypothetical protein
MFYVKLTELEAKPLAENKMEENKNINQQSIFKKITAFFVDHFHLLFKSGSENYLRIQQMKKRQVRPFTRGLSFEIATRDKYTQENIDGTYEYSIQFESFSALKKYQKKLRTVTVSLSSAIAMMIVAFIASPYVLNPNRSSASNFQWIQTSWGTHLTDPDTALASNQNNKTGWDKFSTKDSEIVIDVQGVALVKPAPVSVGDANYTSAVASDGIIAGTYDNATLYKASNSLKLKKQTGVSCGLEGGNPECLSGTCDGGLCIAPCDASTTCGTNCAYGGGVYGSVTVASQCWFNKNLNIGTKLATVATLPSNNNVIEKWCYNEDEAICSTDGAFYTWAEANGLTASCNTTVCTTPAKNQGICPSGWHVPSDSELNNVVGNHGNLSLLLTGLRPNAYYVNRPLFFSLWSSSYGPSNMATQAWYRNGDNNTVPNDGRFSTSKLGGYGVRCIKN